MSMMDGYVVGAVPPYNMLLAGKLVTSLIASREVADVFDIDTNTLRAASVVNANEPSSPQ